MLRRSASTMARDSQTLILPDGRTLGYAEYGLPTGTPLLYFHGFPSSRLEAYAIDAIARRRRLRILALDRPGYGLSTPLPTRRIVDWPADVRCLAEHVGLARFAVLGVSGGGPYALACARALPSEMLSAVGVGAGAMPWKADRRDVMWSSWFAYLAVTYWPSGLWAVSVGLLGLLRRIARTGWATRQIDALLESSVKTRTEAEATGALTGASTSPDEAADETLPIPVRRERLLRFAFEPFEQGTWEFIREMKLMTQDWGFEFEDVTYDPVQVWHGSKDTNAPISMIRYMVERLPHCKFTVYEGKNHYAMGTVMEEIMVELMEDELRRTEEAKRDAED